MIRKTPVGRFSPNAGYAASAILLLLLLASTAYGTYRLLAFQPSESTRRAQLVARLALARDTVIAYAAVDAKRPGRLLCPDLVGNGISPLLTGNECPGYSGWLPWKTLDLPGEGDDRGQAIRYVVSPLFGGDRNTPPLNSETATSLSLDPPANPFGSDIAALLIAPRGPLDPRNADGDDAYFTGRSTAPDDNDIAIPITRAQLMAATEGRIANQLRSCLAEHALSTLNQEQTYPWPAPLGKPAFQGNSGSLFGRFPDTQPGNPEARLQVGIGRLAASKSLLEDSLSTSGRLQILKDLQQEAGVLRGLFDRLHEIAVRLEEQARLAAGALGLLDAKLASSPGAPETLAVLEAARQALTRFITTLDDSGMDCFEQELATLNGKLRADIDKASLSTTSATLGGVLTSINNLKAPLLGSTRTPNPDLQGQVEGNRLLAIEAALAVGDARTRLAQAASALALAQGLVDANARLGGDIRGRRINLDPGELRYRARRIEELAGAAPANGNTASAADLQRTLGATKLLLRQAPAGHEPVQQADTAVATALAAAQANAPSTLAACGEAASGLLRLASWLEAIGDNLALETLKTVDAYLQAASLRPALLINDTGPLRNSLAMAIYWSQVAATQAGELARVSRKSIGAKNDSDTSAYTAARRFLDSLDGSSGSIALLEKFNASSTTPNRDSAERALAASQARLAELIDAAHRLDASLSSGQAKAALPTNWFGSACEFLQAGNAASSWWFTQNWKNLFFYQISDRIRPDSGTLTVNGKGAHTVVVIGAGQPLPGRQDRSQAVTSQFLELRNAHASRDGMALEPTRDFAKNPLAQDFNDQLAH